MPIGKAAPFVLLSLSAALYADAFLEFATRIPNGASVPNPGPQGGVWAGVGHINAGGGGERNGFGADFENSGFEWTLEFCGMDSDGDGRSNGVELGDPSCVWRVGDTPEQSALSHPGIIDEPNEKTLTKTCDGYVPPADELTTDIRFTSPNIMNASLTHFYCEQVEIEAPVNVVLDKIKDAIMIDNSAVLHHMVVYWCQDGTVSTDGDKAGSGPYTCSGNESKCTRVAAWALGGGESCLPENVGFRMDLTKTTKNVFKIEAHYDNPSGQPQQDQSGMRFHLTPTLRPIRGGLMIVGKPTGDNDFVIPPLVPDYSLASLCPTALTEKLSHPVYIFAFLPHMHERGRGLVTEHFRCGEKIGEIGRIEQYEFDNQQIYQLYPPVKVLPGDALVTTCTFDTSNSTTAIVGGWDTTAEMCNNFLSFYPYVGTEEDPNRFQICAAFENGAHSEGQSIAGRFAVAGTALDLFVTDFESDPLQSSSVCCTSNETCDSAYLASIGGACYVDGDCVNAAICNGGLCRQEPAASSAPAESSAPATSADSAASLVGSFVIALGFHFALLMS